MTDYSLLYAIAYVGALVALMVFAVELFCWTLGKILELWSTYRDWRYWRRLNKS